MKRRIAALLLIPALLSLAGCSDSREITKLSIVVGIGLDQGPDPDTIDLSIQVAKAKSLGGGQSDGGANTKPYLFLHAVDQTITGALHVLTNQSSREIFLHHNQVIIIGREQAQKGIKPYMDVFMRDNGMRVEAWVMMADETARDILLHGEESYEEVPALGLGEMMQDHTKIMPAATSCMLDLLSGLIDPYKAETIPILRIKEDEIPGEEGETAIQSRVVVSGMAVLQDGVLVGELTEKETRGLGWLKGNIHDYRLNIEMGQGTATFIIRSLDSRLDVELDDEDRPVVNAKITIVGGPIEFQGFQRTTMGEVLFVLEAELERMIQADIQALMDKSIALQCDILGVGTMIKQYHPRHWQALRHRWQEVQPHVRMNNVAFDVQMSVMGKIGDSILMREEEMQ